MIQELENVILTGDLPERGLTQGDIGTVVLVHEKGKGYEVEFTTLDGGTLPLLPLQRSRFVPASQKRSLMPVISAANP